MNNTFPKPILRIAAGLGAIGVILGAFGAHSLRNKLTIDSLEVFKTAVFYLFIHVLATLVAASLYAQSSQPKWVIRAGWLFLLGIVLFSGSLLIISTSMMTGIRIGAFGIVTPIGGLAFVLGWLCLLAGFFRATK
jgi:uncharacterized membrane protein YgdD (TMEM256/DUF423 family)